MAIGPNSCDGLSLDGLRGPEEFYFVTIGIGGEGIGFFFVFAPRSLLDWLSSCAGNGIEKQAFDKTAVIGPSSLTAS
jgi:hypothetical protein